MSERPIILQFSNAAFARDGELLGLTIETSDGAKTEAAIATKDIGMLATFLMQAVFQGNKLYGFEAPKFEDAYVPESSLPLKGIAFMPAVGSSEDYDLVLQLPGLWLPMRVERTKMVELATEFASIARLLSPTGKAN